MGKAYNVMAATCPSRTVLHRIGARWTVFVVNALADGPRRFTDLKAHIQGITPKVLTETLRSLEVDGLISRHEYAENPPHVEYDLTHWGTRSSSRSAPYGSGPNSTYPTSRPPEPVTRTRRTPTRCERASPAGRGAPEADQPVVEMTSRAMSATVRPSVGTRTTVDGAAVSRCRAIVVLRDTWASSGMRSPGRLGAAARSRRRRSGAPR